MGCHALLQLEPACLGSNPNSAVSCLCLSVVILPHFLGFFISKMAIMIVQKMVSQSLPCYSGMISLARPCSGYFTHEEDNVVLSLDVGTL